MSAESQIVLSGWLIEAHPGGNPREGSPRRWVVMKKKSIDVFATNSSTRAEDALASHSLHTITDLSFGMKDGSRSGPHTFHWFGFCTNAGTVAFVASSTEERDRWLAELRTWVPIRKMEVDKKMLKAKAEGQAIREFQIMQQQWAITQVANAEQRIVVFTTFLDYARELSRAVKEVLKALEIMLVDRMGATQLLAVSIEVLVDKANSAIAATSNRDIKSDIAQQVRRVVTLASTFLQQGRTAVYDPAALKIFQSETHAMQHSLVDFVEYLRKLAMCHDLDKQLGDLKQAVSDLVLGMLEDDAAAAAAIAGPARASVSDMTPAEQRRLFASLRKSQTLLVQAAIGVGPSSLSSPATDIPSPPSTSPPTSPSTSPPSGAVSPRSPSASTRGSLSVSPPLKSRPADASSQSRSPAASSSRATAADSSSGSGSGSAGDEPAPRFATRLTARQPRLVQQQRVSIYAAKALRDVEMLLDRSKTRIREDVTGKEKRKEIFEKTTKVINQGSRLVQKMQEVVELQKDGVPAAEERSLQLESLVFDQGVTALEDSVCSDAVLQPKARRMATKVDAADVQPFSLSARADDGTILKIEALPVTTSYLALASPDRTSTSRSRLATVSSTSPLPVQPRSPHAAAAAAAAAVAAEKRASGKTASCQVQMLVSGAPKAASSVSIIRHQFERRNTDQ